MVVITKDALSDPDLLEEIRMALESEVKITIVQHLGDVPNLSAMMTDESAFQVNEGAVLRSNLSRVLPLPCPPIPATHSRLTGW